MKLLCIKPCWMDETDITYISVGTVYVSKPYRDIEQLSIINDNGAEHFFDEDVYPTYFMDITDLTHGDLYPLFRGKCKELSEALVEEAPDYLTLVRGHVTGGYREEQHWWTIDNQEEIHDPSKLQFDYEPGYIPFNSICTCEQCGKDVPEKEAIMMGRYPTCSDKCAMALVGIEPRRLK